MLSKRLCHLQECIHLTILECLFILISGYKFNLSIIYFSKWEIFNYELFMSLCHSFCHFKYLIEINDITI